MRCCQAVMCTVGNTTGSRLAGSRYPFLPPRTGTVQLLSSGAIESVLGQPADWRVLSFDSQANTDLQASFGFGP